LTENASALKKFQIRLQSASDKNEVIDLDKEMSFFFNISTGSSEEFSDNVFKSFSEDVVNADPIYISRQLKPGQIYVDLSRVSGFSDDFTYVVSVLRFNSTPEFFLLPGYLLDSVVTKTQRYVRDSINSGLIPKKDDLDSFVFPFNDVFLKSKILPVEGEGEVFISPDGALSAIPFEIIPNVDGSYPLLEKSILYVSSPIDFLSSKKHKESDKSISIVSNPNFSLSNVLGVVADSTSRSYHSTFSNLPETQVESDNLSKLGLSKNYSVSILDWTAAKKIDFLKIKSPRVLHVASHGFFVSDKFNYQIGSRKAVSKSFNLNPLLRSGIALAGSNNDFDNESLFALDVSNMDLSGTDIVTLSACDTGAGDISNSEGVVGLTRSFLVAGAKNVISSKWPVSSLETIKYMDYFYSSYFSGISPARSIAEARLKLYRTNINPYYWGGFSINVSNVVSLH
jgi:CHAT domain-containing protein